MNTNTLHIKNNKGLGKANFFVVSAILFVIQFVILYVILKTPVTEFSQNIIKTFVFSFLTISPFYAFLVLFRTIKKKERLLTVKQLFVFILFSLGFFIFTFASDSALLALQQDIDKIPSNIFCFLVIVVYLVLQHILLVRKYRKRKG